MDPTKRRLLEAAGEEFADKGFEGATVRSICQRAEANVAAINYHFGDKEQLYIQAVMEAHRCGVEGAEPIGVMDGSPPEQLRRFVGHFLSNIAAVGDDATWHHNLMLREMLRPSPATERLVRETIRPKFDRLLAILRAIHPDAEGRRLYASAFSVIGQCLHYKIARRIMRKLIGDVEYGQLDPEFLADHITAFSLAALGAGPALRFDEADDHDGAALAAAGGES